MIERDAAAEVVCLYERDGQSAACSISRDREPVNPATHHEHIVRFIGKAFYIARSHGRYLIVIAQ
jgi:hypothetical protein